MFTANAFAILELRAMYYLLADLIHRFVYLKTGLALVLIWVGIKMFLKINIYYIPTPVSLADIAAILLMAVAASLWATRDPDIRVTGIAARVGITTPAALQILKDLESAGYLQRDRAGRRTHYIIRPHQHFRHPATAAQEVDGLINLFSPGPRRLIVRQGRGNSNSRTLRLPGVRGSPRMQVILESSAAGTRPER